MKPSRRKSTERISSSLRFPKRKERFVIRRATRPDLDLLIHQRRAMWEDIGIRGQRSLKNADRIYRKWAKGRLRNGNLLGWVVETPEHIVAGGGCLWLRPEQPRPSMPMQVEPYLLSMYTERQFRRNGVASKIIDEAVKWCRRNGYRRLLLHASNKGRSLYRKYGFVRTREMRLDLVDRSNEKRGRQS